jgi:hypothetical protein
MNLREMKQRYYDAIWAYVAEGGIDPYIVSENSTPAAKARFERATNEVIQELMMKGVPEYED